MAAGESPLPPTQPPLAHWRWDHRQLYCRFAKRMRLVACCFVLRRDFVYVHQFNPPSPHHYLAAVFIHRRSACRVFIICAPSWSSCAAYPQQSFHDALSFHAARARAQPSCTLACRCPLELAGLGWCTNGNTHQCRCECGGVGGARVREGLSEFATRNARRIPPWHSICWRRTGRSRLGGSGTVC